MNSSSIQYVVDIGACVGLFIDECLSKYPIENMYAFEPLSANYEHLVNKYAQDARVEIFHRAVSNFNGQAPLHKKRYRKQWHNFLPYFRYSFAGNAGSSLNPNKSNVSRFHKEQVEVVRITDMLRQLHLPRIDILKIDAEGSEYDILLDLIDDDLLSTVTNIYYEDHTRKIPSLAPARNTFIKTVKNRAIQDKFYVQGEHLAYTPLSEHQDYSQRRRATNP